MPILEYKSVGSVKTSLVGKGEIMKRIKTGFLFCILALIFAVGIISGCSSNDSTAAPTSQNSNGNNAFNQELLQIESAVVLLVIDEESIDNDASPNSFKDTQVNDHIAEVGVRHSLPYFRNNVGRVIDLYTGQVGDEGWFAPKTIPNTWIETGPTDNGTWNYLTPGPGLGSGNPDDGKEVLLDKIPDVTPLRATGQAMLIGQVVLGVVYDGNVGINYSPLSGNLMGANYGLVAFRVLDVQERRDASTGSLPKVTIQILDIDEALAQEIVLFANAPVIPSSGEPYDVRPPSNPDSPVYVPAP